MQNEKLESEKNIADDLRYEIIRLMAPDQTKYLCQVPLIKTHDFSGPNRTAKEDKTEANDATEDHLESTQDIVKRAVAALEKMNTRCIFAIQGWWSYEYCHKNYLRQFHQERAENNIHITTEYRLGIFEDDTLENARLADSGTMSGKALSIKLFHGTSCDLTNKPRQVEVLLSCKPGHLAKILTVKESSACQYVVSIQTPDLCQVPEFIPRDSNNTNNISCYPIGNLPKKDEKSSDQSIDDHPNKKANDAGFEQMLQKIMAQKFGVTFSADDGEEVRVVFQGVENSQTQKPEEISENQNSQESQEDIKSNSEALPREKDPEGSENVEKTEQPEHEEL